uniref:NADH dehydrogenase subunit 6 n=1 Tax=Ovatella vulcani TaxID=999270 RepID=G8HP97_9EUPU|nr:NADH dehydrogenase subunit 6 [Ovatella vulcani]AEQ93846.1 NADH dehydrogenase subunit 6 [Ovatella vulcani]
MFELAEYSGLLTLFLIASFPIFTSPIGLGGMLVLISFMLVVQLAMYFSGWYAYILFLVYIGGLLVLFIYVCMVSSNYRLSASPKVVVPVVLRVLVASVLVTGATSTKILGFSGWESGGALSLGLFIGLVILLLVAFLAVARIITGGSVAGSIAVSVGTT